MFETTKSEYELFRERNIKERDAMLASSDDDSEAEEFKRTLKNLQEYVKPTNPVRIGGVKRKRQNQDTTFRFTGFIPNQRRKSQRIAKLPPSHTEYDLEDNEDKRSDDMDDVENLEKIVFRPKKKARRLQPQQSVIFLSVDEVTERMIANIAQSSTKKIYSQLGTSCHQCRQKTTDQKTVCRSGKCVGINGQMCGPCLKNRYGEDVAAALKNPNWQCPYCRGICNCSFCRAHQGKRPTGILAPMALSNGFQSVKHFLENLNGYGDFAKEEDSPKKVKKEFEGEPFLGFSQSEVDSKCCKA